MQSGDSLDSVGRRSFMALLLGALGLSAGAVGSLVASRIEQSKKRSGAGSCADNPEPRFKRNSYAYNGHITRLSMEHGKCTTYVYDAQGVLQWKYD
jgi:surface antigen